MSIVSAERLTLSLPEPPTVNEMVDLAKKRRRIRRGRHAVPIVYDVTRKSYQTLCLAMALEQEKPPPKEPWVRWQVIDCCFFVHQLRDPIELLAGLKWPIDFLHKCKYVLDDSPRELLYVPYYMHDGTGGIRQVLERRERGVVLTIGKIEETGSRP